MLKGGTIVNNIFLLGYNVKGIKTLDEMVSLSFYKKSITMPIETNDYNVKGIYGMNGSGKSGIVSSVEILKNLLINANYLNNPVVQKNLEASINKKTKSLYIGADFILKITTEAFLYKYEITIEENETGKYVVASEKLSSKKATSRKESLDLLFDIRNGEIVTMNSDENDILKDMLVKRTTNLLSTSTISSLFIEKILAKMEINKSNTSFLLLSLFGLFLLGKSMYVYMDQSDNHVDFFISDMLKQYTIGDSNKERKPVSYLDSLVASASEMDRNKLNMISIGTNIIPKDSFAEFEKNVNKLYDFIHIFKSDLTDIVIDKKENGDVFACNLNLVYDTYSINTEFESTGIKKLIKLFTYFQEMMRGGIVFIDELDSNLHDVYLCALLEYLMEYGEGQLCFTTHNVGPMDILKKRSKSIDFLSVDHKIYSWAKNGNYSPSKLYKNGMIEGSPFNVDSIDFIGVFDSIGEDA